MISKCTNCGALLACEHPEGTEVDCAACGRVVVAKPASCEQCRVCKTFIEIPPGSPESMVCGNCGHIVLLRPPSSPNFRTSRRLVVLIATICLLAPLLSSSWFFAIHKGNTRQIETAPESSASDLEVAPAIETADATCPASLAAHPIPQDGHPGDQIPAEGAERRFDPPNVVPIISASEDPSIHLAETQGPPPESAATAEPIAANAPPESLYPPIADMDQINETNPLHSLLSIKTDLGCGTGFIVEHDGKKYILTNQHVLEAIRQITFTAYDGTVFRPSTIEVNRSSDLARVDVSGSPLPGLRLDTIEPNTDDLICVYGDSGGEQVYTKLSGRILGVGPDKLEVSADFIPGNSGSPIISSRGQVLGVATYLLPRAAPSDYLLTGTRFAKPRRFGLRYDPQDRWVRVPTAEFIRQQAVLDETERYLVNVLSVMFCWLGDPALQEKARAYFESTVTQPMTRHYYDTKWTEHISIFADRYGSYWKDRFRLHTDDGRLNRTQVMLGTILVALAEQPKNNLIKQAWASDALETRAKYLEEYMALFTKECTAITKRAGWDKCVIEDALKRNRRPDGEIETPTYPFIYDEHAE